MAEHWYFVVEEKKVEVARQMPVVVAVVVAILWVWLEVEAENENLKN